MQWQKKKLHEINKLLILNSYSLKRKINELRNKFSIFFLRKKNVCFKIYFNKIEDATVGL